MDFLSHKDFLADMPRIIAELGVIPGTLGLPSASNTRWVGFITHRDIANLRHGATVYAPKRGLITSTISDDGSPGQVRRVREEVSQLPVADGESVSELMNRRGSSRPFQYDLAIVYAGIRNIQMPLHFAKQIGQTAPVYVVTCGCVINKEPQKQGLFREAMESGNVRGVIVGPDCGGEDAMRAIYDRIVELF